MTLTKYKEKRHFKDTPEPESGESSGKDSLRFVVQRHAASHLHYDFRLEMEGVLKSWAVPKGPSLDPGDKRLAMMVEDHPFNYRTFAGVIPEGNYGAGIVEIWDEGFYHAEGETDRKKREKLLLQELKKGSLKFVLDGKKLKGSFALVKMHGKQDNAWLLLKHDDKYTEKSYNSEEHVPASSQINKKLAAKKKGLTHEGTPSKKVHHEQEHLPQIPEGAGKAAMPDMIKPMLAKLVDKPFDSNEWIFELKWDGYRAMANIDNGSVKLYSRNGLIYKQFPIIKQELEKLAFEAVLDGEIVALDKDGVPRFQYLQNYETDGAHPLQYEVFDIVHYNGHDLKKVPLVRRKELLKQLLGDNVTIKYTEHIECSGIDFFNEIKSHELEGIIGKLADSPYRLDKRSGEWVKIKTGKRQEAIVCGYTAPKGGRKNFGSLVLGVYDDKGVLKNIGSSGGGFDEKSLAEIYAQLQEIRQEKSPFGYKIPQKSKVYWVKPVLICEVAFSEWTGDGQMRHPVFQGLRPDKNPEDVKIEKTAKTMDTVKSIEDKPDSKTGTSSGKTKADAKGKGLTISGRSLQVTNLNKVLWPDEGITKGDLINYYRSVAKYILPFLKNRPESLNRFPNGIKEKNFYQKNMETAPEWAETIKIKSDSKREEVNYLVCNNEATLVYMANLACIEIHPWNSKIGSLDKPDWIVMDIDPGDTNTFEQVIDTALVVKTIMDKANAGAYIKTSGATGLHIYIPMGAKYTYEEGKTFANVMAEMTVAQLPDTTTTVRHVNQRDGKIYVDYLQNNQGQTLASVFSVRPKPGATVSMPLEWSEVKHGLHPSQFTIKNALARIEKQGDIFKPVLGKGIDMAKCLKLLGA
jgi:bifunctional non-homologous end joining protein LigD